MAKPRSFRVIILASGPAGPVARLTSRIHKEVQGAAVCGILYGCQTPKPFSKRALEFWQHLREWPSFTYAFFRTVCLIRGALAQVVDILLRWIHAGTREPNGPVHRGILDLTRVCETFGCSLMVATDMYSPGVFDFVQGLQPELGIVCGGQALKAELFGLPRQGSIRKVPDNEASGAVGLWELVNGLKELSINVQPVQAGLDAAPVIRRATVPIEPFDTLTSLALKADLIGNDLLVRSVADFARGTLQEKPHEVSEYSVRSLTLEESFQYQRQVASRRTGFKPKRARATWKLLARTLVFAPFVIIRNWTRRLRGSFPLIVLYHHVVTDRPHYMGVSTEMFQKQVEFLWKHYKIASISEAIEMLNNKTVKTPTVVLTFDDGYEDNFINLRAVTEATGIPVTLFVCTKNVANRVEFQHDLECGYRNFLPLSWEQITLLNRNGFEIGSHTRSHYDCGSTDLATLRDEIVGSKSDLEQYLGREVRCFSFPWGKPAHMSPAAVELAHAAYSYVFSAYGGTNCASQKGKLWHLRRCGHALDLWELELALQSVLELRAIPDPPWAKTESCF